MLDIILPWKISIHRQNYCECYLKIKLIHMELCTKKKDLPADFWSWKPTKGVGEPPKVKLCNELIICRWNDAYKTKSVKIVSMMSTKHTGELVDTGKTHFQTKRNILKPDVIHEYNATMGGVDNLSRIINPYNMQRK